MIASVKQKPTGSPQDQMVSPSSWRESRRHKPMRPRFLRPPHHAELLCHWHHGKAADGCTRVQRRFVGRPELEATNLQTLRRDTLLAVEHSRVRKGGLRWRNISELETTMPRGDRSSYTDRQKRQAKHIEEGYEEQGVPEKEAERRAWVTVNKQDHGGKKSASGVGCAKDTSSSRKGRRRGGRASANRPSAARSRSGKKAAATRRSRGS
jgi:hypothetical protein